MFCRSMFACTKVIYDHIMGLIRQACRDAGMEINDQTTGFNEEHNARLRLQKFMDPDT